MERITSKLTRVLVITLLSAATLATAGSLTSKASTGVTPQAKTPTPPYRQCLAARAAREKKDSTADYLETQCLNEFSARGEELSNEDSEAAQLRSQQPAGLARRGFEIGMAVWEGETVPGPGKTKYRGWLSTEEQGGFDVAASYSMVRNRLGRNGNAQAARGADMATEDDSAAESRYRQPERPVRRGSDSRSLRATLEHLRQGKEFLENATPDQDGHLYKAIDDINNAIEELEKALRGRN